MIAKVAIIAPGAMGSAVGRRLSEHGARVLTSLTKRSIATVRRAEMTGMIGADDDAIAQADVILSILPPNEAFALAERFAAPLSRASHKAIFADCNAINVETVRRIDAVITPTGAAAVAQLTTTFTRDPPGAADKLGIGAGIKRFPTRPNIVRVHAWI